MEASDLYADLLELTPEQQKIQINKIRERDKTLAEDLESMLMFSSGNLTVTSNDLFSFQTNQKAAPDFIGKEVMGFKIVKILSEGGATGQVYLAVQTIVSPETSEQNRHYAAVKILRGSVLTLRERQRLFYREASNLTALNNPYICKLYGSGEIDGALCIVTEFVNGNQLDTFLLASRPSKTKRLKLLQQLLDGMAYAHRHGLYHGDLKPQNLLVDEQSNIKIIDLGFSKRLDDIPPLNDKVEEDYINAFSHHWSPPEQKLGIWYRSRSDIYSLGVLFFYLLSEGKHTETDLPLDSEPRIPYLIANGFCRESTAIITKAIHPDAEKRYRDADEMREDVDRWLKGYPVNAYSQKLTYRIQKRVLRHPLISGTLVSAALLLLIGSVSFIHKHFDLIAEKQTTDEVIEQLSNVLLFSQPALFHSFESPTIVSLYLHASTQWLDSHHMLTAGAHFQTGKVLVMGLQALQEYKIAGTLLSILSKHQVRYSSDEQADIKVLQLKNSRGIMISTPDCQQQKPIESESESESDFCPKQTLATENWHYLAKSSHRTSNDWRLFAELIQYPHSEPLQHQTLIQEITGEILDSAAQDRQTWSQLAFDEKHDILMLLSNQYVTSTVHIPEHMKHAVITFLEDWIQSTSTASNKYRAANLAKNIAYGFNLVEKAQHFSDLYQSLRAKALPLNTKTLSFEPLTMVDLRDPEKSKASLRAVEKSIISKYGETVALSSNAINSLASAYLLLGDIQKANEVLQLDESTHFQISAEIQPLFTTAPSQMIVAIFQRDWQSFHQAFNTYKALSMAQDDQRLLTLDPYFELFETLLKEREVKQSSLMLQDALPEHLDWLEKNVYLHYATRITGHHSQSHAFFSRLLNHQSTDKAVARIISTAPLMEEAITCYAQQLLQAGYTQRSINLLVNLLARKTNNHPSDFTKMQVLFLANGYLQNNNTAAALQLWQDYKLSPQQFSYRSDLYKLAVSIQKVSRL
ncbi:serine/threonine protein kinase [Photobacterium sanguinicancri]|uniref:serine/threonine protein kinase n=1 Tax=Photobacterium sanguinicancri TaxID=875932 RepID=UPI002480162D|nr:serine/threonine-protein kinase [Photobacterium sanguinicancri]